MYLKRIDEVTLDLPNRDTIYITQRQAHFQPHIFLPTSSMMDFNLITDPVSFPSISKAPICRHGTLT